MKVPPHLLAEIVSALGSIFVDARYADRVVAVALKEHPKWGSRDRRLFAESVYECVRWWRWYWYLAGLPDADHARPDGISREQLTQVWAAYWVSSGQELPPNVWIDTAAVSQRAQREMPCAIRASIPDWLEHRGQSELGAAWPGLRDALNHPAPVFLRVNTLKNDIPEAQQRLLEEGFQTEQVPHVPYALQLASRGKVSASRAFKDGRVEVQDAASQLIAPFLHVEPGQCVVDACAGGGGKALHLAALMQNRGRIIAMDVHAWKLDELEKRAARAGVSIIESKVIDSDADINGFAACADRVLLDVPCSGLGVLRRNPDAKWKMTDAEVERLLNLQAEILNSYSRMVRPGGKLVYATCSILPSENEQQVAAFIAEHSGEWLLEDDMHRTPETGIFDGFYAARLQRKRTPSISKSS